MSRIIANLNYENYFLTLGGWVGNGPVKLNDETLLLFLPFFSFEFTLMRPYLNIKNTLLYLKLQFERKTKKKAGRCFLKKALLS